MGGYQILVAVFHAVFSIFFRAIQVRGSYKIPQTGPVIFVAAPHANQFVDPMMIIINCWNIAKRKVSFLIAEVSYHRPMIGKLARMANAIPVGRTQDTVKVAKGKITSEGVEVIGEGTKFSKDCVSGHYLIVEGEKQTIDKIEDNTHLKLKKPFSSSAALNELKNGALFKTAAKVDHKKTFQSVFDHLANGNCIGIFPEGGSHDRTDLLPMKNGVSIMALGTLADHPDCGLKVVPVGLNYFHPHKFRSRLVIEFGNSITPSKEQIKRYREGGEEAQKVVTEFLDEIQEHLRSVTVSCPDYETLQLVQACRRLYRPRGNRGVPLALMTEFTRRMVKGYAVYKDNPKIIQLRGEIIAYNARLHSLGIRDHQVLTSQKSQHELILRFIYQLASLVVLIVSVIPSFIVNLPALTATKLISRAKAREALRKSSVKVRARDVITTWKVLVALWFIPTLYTCYSSYVALRWVNGPAWYKLWIFCLTYGILLMISLTSIKLGDSGADAFKNIVPLFMALSPRYSEKFEDLRKQREDLVFKVTEIINELGPTILKDNQAKSNVVPWSAPILHQIRRTDSVDSMSEFGTTSAVQSGSDVAAEITKRVKDVMS